MTKKMRYKGQQDLLTLLDTVLDQTSLKCGEVACVLRQGRPWRLNRITAIRGNILTVDTGHEYDLNTGAALQPASGLVLTPLKRVHVEYLMVLEAQRAAQHFVVRNLTDDQWHALVPGAGALLSLIQDLQHLHPEGLHPRFRVLEHAD
ncbi:hypothetical protein LAJ19_16565 (plasmid) [Deinococcus taeanensis]|uniref:hypothetical protein n=1 Tax=Deinococcus taeanensis TaxID=2737050 RepID=UPI001CDC4F38|nr:hypothetical protein [Deinococcus taeanensis]UBV44763.1 hypothetical protein LAJ19_16565 [Deinococcus taeanensis]